MITSCGGVWPPLCPVDVSKHAGTQDYLLKVGAPKMKILARTTEGDNSTL